MMLRKLRRSETAAPSEPGAPSAAAPVAATETCQSCGTATAVRTLRDALWVCAACGAHLPMPVGDRIAALADPGTFKEFDRRLISVDPLHFADQRTYRTRLMDARKRTGLREAVVVGQAQIDGLPVVLAVFEFRFLGGTMGSVVGEKIANAFEVATRRRLPLIAITSTGGARMQEGMLSLVQMAKTAAARARHHAAGLAQITVFGHPTFGGVTASFASLGDVLIAEPGAQIGFVGRRVIETTMGEVLPPNSHQAERLFEGGMVDLLTHRQQLRKTLGYLVRHLRRRPLRQRRATRLPATVRADGPPPSAWDVVQIARHPQRPGLRDYIRRIVMSFVELHGDRLFSDDPVIVGGLGEIDGQTVVVVGQDRTGTKDPSSTKHRGMAYPEGYREALRLMQLASKFRLPLITFVDTPGAYPGYEAERHGIAQALAQNLMGMALLETPIVSVVIGEGGSGGALALAAGDRVLMQEYAFYSVISPEAASAILYGDAAHAPEVAAALKLTAADLLRLGVIDGIIPEPFGGAHSNHNEAAEQVKRYVSAALGELSRLRPDRLLDLRYRKFRQMGQVGGAWRDVVREVQEVLGAVEHRLPRRDPGTRQRPASSAPGQPGP